jgi:hypothetical protein
MLRRHGILDDRSPSRTMIRALQRPRTTDRHLKLQTMPTPDLDIVQKEINDSRKAFLAASKSYDQNCANDGVDITERFLFRMLEPNPKRVEETREHAKETIAYLRAFGNARADFTTEVAFVNLRMDQTMTSLRMAALKAAMNTIPTFDELMSHDRTRMENFQKIAAQGTEDASRIGGYVARVQLMAASLLLTRQKTLLEFRQEHFDTSLLERASRSLDQLRKDAKADATGTAIDAACKVAETLFHVALDASLTGKVIRLGVRVVQFTKSKEVDFSTAATDVMMQLREQLQAEEKAFEQLKSVYKEASTEMDNVMKSLA